MKVVIMYSTYILAPMQAFTIPNLWTVAKYL